MAVLPADASPEPGSSASPEVLAFYTEVLQALAPRVDELVSEIADRIVERVPGLAGDDRVLQAIQRTAHSNIQRVVELLTEPELSLEAPAAAVAIAGAFVRSEQPLSVLIESYHVGQALFIDTWLESLAGATEDARLLSSATLDSYRRVCAYLDAVLARIVEQYLADRQRWQARRVRRQWQVVQSLLDGALTEAEATASTALGYDLSRTHLAAILMASTSSERRDEEGIDPSSLLDVARALAQHVDATRPLTLAAGPGLVYAWMPVTGDAHLAAGGFEAPAGVRIAVGSPAQGVDGFRVSHQQARWAQQLLRHASELPALVAYPDVAALCVLRDDMTHLRCFVAEQLGGLARRDHETEVLRETLAVALAESLNASSASRSLSVHKNTVLYRLRAAEELRGRPITEHRLELELALHILDAHGEELLGPDSSGR